MKLTDQHQGRSRRQGKSAFGFMLAFAIGLLLIVLLWNKSNPINTSHPDIIRLFCGAENSQGSHFKEENYVFGGAAFQSADEAKSGRFSIALPQRDEAVFAFTTLLEKVIPGASYQVTAWRKGANSSIVQLAAMDAKGGGFYLDTGETVLKDENGWEKLELKFTMPFTDTPEKLSIYVYSDGSAPAYVDDFEINIHRYQGNEHFQVEKINLQIERQDWAKIQSKRTEALKTGILISDNDDWVKAQISLDSSEILPAKTRLKGDWLDHLRGEKWSFRVKLKSPYAWRQMLVFNLHTPAARYHLHEWLLHQFWTKADVLTPRYDFVELEINGQTKGVYAYEEHFEKQLVESKQRREGPILKLSEEGFWESRSIELAHHGFIRTGADFPGNSMMEAPIRSFNEGDITEDSLQSQYLQYAKLLLRQYLNGELAPEVVFDLPKLAAFYAGCDLFNAYHGTVWHNQRFYFNPITSKLEPIGFDGFGGAPPVQYGFLLTGALRKDKAERNTLFAQLLQSPAFMENYAGALAQYSDPDYLNTFFEEVSPDWHSRLNWLQLEFPEYKPDLDEIRRQIQFVRAQLYPAISTCLRARSLANGELMLANTHTLPVKISGFGQSQYAMTDELAQPLWLPGQPIRQMAAKLEKDSLIQDFASMRFANEQALATQSTLLFSKTRRQSQAQFVYYQVVGLDSVFVSPLVIQNDDVNLLLPTGVQQTASASDFPSLIFEQGSIIVPAGEHLISKDLVIGADQIFVVQAGAQIDLRNQAAIISHSAIRAIGQPDQTILIHSSDGTGQGLQVMESQQASILRQVTFSNLRNLHRSNWHLTGAVTFYESAVFIEECVFQNNQSEDALNLIRCEAELNRVKVRNTSADGIDMDFCKAEINELEVRQTANDGLDVSGSIVSLQNSSLQECQDKGISVGEASDMFLLDVEITDCPIALAAKDLSVVLARKVILENCVQGFVAFQKKPEFGAAKIVVEQYTATAVKKLYEIGPGSRLQLDDKVISN